MKILDIPQSGKRGLYVSQGGRYGQISRAFVIPSNPRTASQTSVRAILTRVAAAWRGLQESQRAAWTAAASGVNSTSRLGQNTIVRGSKPVSQGYGKFTDFRVLGMCPAPVQGSADITSLYTARYGVPAVGTKVFVSVNQFVDGWEDLPVTFAAIVPASA